MVTLQGLLYSPIITYLPSYLGAFTSPFSTGLVLSVLNASSVPGQILTGALCDRSAPLPTSSRDIVNPTHNFSRRFPYPNVMFCSASVCAATIFGLLRVGDTLPKMFGFSVLLGLCGGGATSTWFPACTDGASAPHSQISRRKLTCTHFPVAGERPRRLIR